MKHWIDVGIVVHAGHEATVLKLLVPSKEDCRGIHGELRLYVPLGKDYLSPIGRLIVLGNLEETGRCNSDV